MVNDIEIIMRDIDKLMEQELFDESYEKYRLVDSNLNRVNYIQFGMKENEKEVLAEFYSSYAYFLISFGEYEKFFKMYIKAQKCGYSSEKRRKFLYETFIEPNIETLKKNYKINISNMKEKCSIERMISFDELPYWLITTGQENEYYLYEKETELIGRKVSFEVEAVLDIEVTEKSSDYLVMESSSWSETLSYIKEITSENKRAYLITEDIEKFMSYLQGHIIEKSLIDNLVIFKNIDDFGKYFMNRNNYLPREFIGRNEEKMEYEKLIKEIHKYRLTKEGRCGKDVLLSICIPSFNRGKRAYDNIIHTIKSEFDEEIEIILCNNGTQKESEVYYEKISKMNDSRLSYFKFKENKYFHMSLLKILELANGKYALLLSDEDRIDLNQLRYLINILKCKEENISLIRTNSDGQGITPYVGMANPGEDSLYKFMLTSNYMSGCIYNKEILNKYNVIEYIGQKLENVRVKNIKDFNIEDEDLKNGACFFYPHMVCELLACQYGHVLGLDMTLINEGKSIAEKHNAFDKSGTVKILSNATLEARLVQHKGFFDIIKELETSRKSFNALRKTYIRLCYKTIFLVDLTIRVFYKEKNIETNKLLKTTYNFVIECLDELYKDKKNNNEKDYLEDLSKIKACYDNM